MGNRYLYGLITTNHSLSKNDLQVNTILNLTFKKPKKTYDYTISQNTFVFTCNFIGISFLEIPVEFIKDIEYLKVLEYPIEKQKVCVCQVNQEDNLIFNEGNSLGFFGTQMLYNIIDPYENNQLCTPIISLSKDSLGHVIAIRPGISLIENKIYSSISINIIFRCIKSLVHQNKINPSETLSDAKNLSLTEVHVLRREGLKDTENPNVFISPASQGITPLWFYRTHYAWFWTPTEPKNFSMEELLKCNWSLIQGNFPIKVFGGFWHNMPPAQRNVVLIKYLINSGLRFLLG